MKTNLISICLTLTLLTLVGCGAKEKSVTLEVSTGFALTSAGFTGGLVVSGKNSTNQRFVKTVFGGSSINVVLPDGTWELSVVGWDGAAPSAGQAPFDGDAYCGKTTLNLGTNDLSANVTISKANCLSSDFSGGDFYDAASNPMVIKPLRIVTCGSFYNHSTSPVTKITSSNSNTFPSNYCNQAAHPLDLKSRSKSMKIIPLQKELNTNFAGTPALNPHCKTSFGGQNGIFQLAEQIPVSGLPLQINFYDDENCTIENSKILFPDGILAGHQSFDSIIDQKGAESGLPKSNRLILSDNELNRGYSPLIDLMPDMKCNGEFCGDTSLSGSLSIFDYFIEIDYLNNNPAQTIRIPSKTNLCSGVTFYGFIDTTSNKSNCNWDSSNQMVEVKVAPKTDASCSSMIDGICRSPEKDFSFKLADNIIRTIYFKGNKDYSGAPVVPFTHFPEPQALNLNPGVNCSNLGAVLGTMGTYSVHWFCSSSDISVLPVNSSGTYQVSETTPFSLQYQDIFSNPQTKTYYMLPPEQWNQKNIIVDIADALGSNEIKKTFAYYHFGEYEDDNKDHPNQDKYGSISRVREMFSPDGPAALFDHNTTCLNLTGTKAISFTEDGVTENYEITITNTDSNTTAKDRPDGFCHPTNPTITTAICDSNSWNNGNYEKKMTIKKDGILESVMLFDCGQKSGRLEALYSENKDGKYRREKELLYWITEDSTLSRYERYAISMEASSSSYTDSYIQHKNYSIEKIYKITESNIEGEIVEYSLNRDPSNQLNQSVNYLRFNLDDATNFFSYADYSFYEPYPSPAEQDFFTTGTGEKYDNLKKSHHTDQHFCSAYQFPISYSASCSNVFADTPSEVHPLALSFSGPTNANSLTLEHVNPAYLKGVLTGGYFSISTW